MTAAQETALLDACRILFPTALVTKDFLGYIRPDGLKNAYRSRAWEQHPDAAGDDIERCERTAQFRRTVDAYKLLDNYLKDRKTPLVTLRAPQQRTPFPKPVIEPLPLQGRHPDETYYDDLLPTYEMKTGLYLYYRGLVSYQAVVRALLWQREMRPALGDYARQWGWLTERDIELVLRTTDIVGSFGERALELGLLTQSQLNLLLLQQRSRQQPIGRYFVSNALLSEMMLSQQLRELAEHNRSAREARERLLIVPD